MKQEYINILLKMSKKAYRKNEIPVSSIIVYNDKVIAKAYNKKNISNCSLYHAEILCIMKACKKLKRWNLNGCEMYVSLEPCLMCKEAIEESRIDKVYYVLSKGLISNKYSKTKYEQMYVPEYRRFSNLFSKIFKKIRK